MQATNPGGTTTGSILTYNTAATPAAVTTQAATAVTTTGATLNSSGNPEGSATTVTFVYGTDPTLTTGTTTTTAQTIGSGTSAQAVTAPLTGLAPNTTYFFEVQATNPGGTTTGSILTYSTAATPPAVTTQAATAVTTTGATLGASVNPEGTATTVSFVYGTDPTLTSGTTTTTAQSIGGGASAQAVTAPLAGLTPATTYFFEVQATNAGGTTTGSILSFSTVASPAVLQFSSGQFLANVTDGAAQVVVTRAGNPSASITVVVSSPGGHEVAAFSEQITFGPNVLSESISIPIVNDGQPGEGDIVIPLNLSSPGARRRSAAMRSANLVNHDTNTFPPLVTITGLQLPTVTVGTGKKAKKVQVIQLHLSGAVNGAGNSTAYQLLSGKTSKGVTTFKKNVPVTSAVYNPTAHTVDLFVAGKLNLAVPEKLQVTAAAGDGRLRPSHWTAACDGQPGGNYVSIFQQTRDHGQPASKATSASAVDALMARGLMPSVRAARHNA